MPAPPSLRHVSPRDEVGDASTPARSSQYSSPGRRAYAGERAQACCVVWAPGSMLGRQTCRATCRQGHCLSAMQPGRGLGTCLASRSPATRRRSCSAALSAQSSLCRPRAPGARAALPPASLRPDGHGLWDLQLPYGLARRPITTPVATPSAAPCQPSPPRTARPDGAPALHPCLGREVASRGRSRNLWPWPQQCSFAARRTTSPAPLRLGVWRLSAARSLMCGSGSPPPLHTRPHI